MAATASPVHNDTSVLLEDGRQQLDEDNRSSYDGQPGLSFSPTESARGDMHKMSHEQHARDDETATTNKPDESVHVWVKSIVAALPGIATERRVYSLLREELSKDLLSGNVVRIIERLSFPAGELNAEWEPDIDFTTNALKQTVVTSASCANAEDNAENLSTSLKPVTTGEFMLLRELGSLGKSLGRNVFDDRLKNVRAVLANGTADTIGKPISFVPPTFSTTTGAGASRELIKWNSSGSEEGGVGLVSAEVLHQKSTGPVTVPLTGPNIVVPATVEVGSSNLSESVLKMMEMDQKTLEEYVAARLGSSSGIVDWSVFNALLGQQHSSGSGQPAMSFPGFSAVAKVFGTCVSATDSRTASGERQRRAGSRQDVITADDDMATMPTSYDPAFMQIPPFARPGRQYVSAVRGIPNSTSRVHEFSPVPVMEDENGYIPRNIEISTEQEAQCKDGLLEFSSEANASVNGTKFESTATAAALPSSQMAEDDRITSTAGVPDLFPCSYKERRHVRSQTPSGEKACLGSPLGFQLLPVSASNIPLTTTQVSGQTCNSNRRLSATAGSTSRVAAAGKAGHDFEAVDMQKLNMIKQLQEDEDRSFSQLQKGGLTAVSEMMGRRKMMMYYDQEETEIQNAFPLQGSLKQRQQQQQPGFQTGENQPLLASYTASVVPQYMAEGNDSNINQMVLTPLNNIDGRVRSMSTKSSEYSNSKTAAQMPSGVPNNKKAVVKPVVFVKNNHGGRSKEDRTVFHSSKKTGVYEHDSTTTESSLTTSPPAPPPSLETVTRERLTGDSMESYSKMPVTSIDNQDRQISCSPSVTGGLFGKPPFPVPNWGAAITLQEIQATRKQEALANRSAAAEIDNQRTLTRLQVIPSLPSNEQRWMAADSRALNPQQKQQQQQQAMMQRWMMQQHQASQQQQQHNMQQQQQQHNMQQQQQQHNMQQQQHNMQQQQQQQHNMQHPYFPAHVPVSPLMQHKSSMLRQPTMMYQGQHQPNLFVQPGMQQAPQHLPCQMQQRANTMQQQASMQLATAQQQFILWQQQQVWRQHQMQHLLQQQQYFKQRAYEEQQHIPSLSHQHAIAPQLPQFNSQQLQQQYQASAMPYQYVVTGAHQQTEGEQQLSGSQGEAQQEDALQQVYRSIFQTRQILEQAVRWQQEATGGLIDQDIRREIEDNEMLVQQTDRLVMRMRVSGVEYELRRELAEINRELSQRRQRLNQLFLQQQYDSEAGRLVTQEPSSRDWGKSIANHLCGGESNSGEYAHDPTLPHFDLSTGVQ